MTGQTPLPTPTIRRPEPLPRPPRRNGEHGFTLIELVVVVLILGVFVFSLVPNEAFQRFQLEAAVQRVENDLQYCRELASLKNIRCGVTFAAFGNYTVYENNPGTPAVDPLTRQPFVTDLAEQFRGVNVLNDTVVEFDPLGRPVVGGGALVRIGDTSTTRTLSITANTGLVQKQ